MAAIIAAPSASFPLAAAIRARCRPARWSSRSAASSPMAIPRSCCRASTSPPGAMTCRAAPKLGNLVRRILKSVPDLKRLRLSSIDSIEADDELMRAIAEEERLMPHLHLSLQSGDDMILKRMKRRHSRDDSIAFCARAAPAARPIWCSAPTSSPAFRPRPRRCSTIRSTIVDECGLTYLHVFPFSPRPGTPAARMPQVDKAVIKERAAPLARQGQGASSMRFCRPRWARGARCWSKPTRAAAPSISRR